ncbi:hypothetical protein F4779DRAFT_608714 [Xylariaceae sp. FL0662B]|nr:hypothetical protein F4779DRAFT_608714 [Xylariaceae sp. FL0662B]
MNHPSQGQPAQGQPPVRLLKPEHMRTMSYLNPEERQKYEEGLRTLWTKIEQNPPDTAEHQAAKQKVLDFSRMVLNKVRNIHARSAQGQQGQPGQHGQHGQQGQPSAQLQVTQGGQAQSAMAAAQRSTAMAASRSQGPTPANNVPNAGHTVHNAGPTSAQHAMTKSLMDHVNKLPWHLLPMPGNVPPEQGPKFINDTKQRYLRCLMQMENLKPRITRLDAIIREREQKGQAQSDETKKFIEQKNQDAKLYQEADKFVKSVRAQMQAASQNGGAQGQNMTQPGRSQSVQNQNAGAAASSHPMQAATASVNAAMDAAKNQQLAAANRASGPAGQVQSQTPATPATPSTSAPQQPSHLSAPAPQAQVKIEPGAHTQHPPPVNTALAATASAHMPSAGTPTQASARVQTPQSTTQQAPGSQVRPLTHAAAVNRANSSTNVAGQPSGQSTGAIATPGSGNLTNNASQPGHPHAHPQPNTSAITNKMPIPKSLPDASTGTPQPAAVGGGTTPGRPTYGGGTGTGGGITGQTVIPKMNAPQFDTEGDHVLSKKKLDELVRQVCGGGSPGADGNYLTPDVEESVLSVADNFVDNILHTACRLAKERGSKVLEIRDIQLVLERIYNIRIPGYTSDELRTVRKVQPSPNWISKMSAVQAAKVMPGKDDK